MKKVIVIACMAAFLLSIANIAFAAGTDDDWRVFMRASTTTYTNFTPLIQLGTRPHTTDDFDSGFGNDAYYTAPTTAQAIVVSYRPEYAAPYLRSDFMAPIQAPEVKTWDLLLWAGTDWTVGTTVRLGIWSTQLFPVNERDIQGVPYQYVVTVVNDRTGTYEVGAEWILDMKGTGSSTAPELNIDFNDGHLIATADGNAPSAATVLRFTAEPVPEPGSLLALASGLVGMAGFAIRRRRA